MEIKLDAIEVSVDDQPLDGTLMYPAEKWPGVLFVHGWGGSQEQDLARARQAAGLGSVCLTFDLRGHEPESAMWRSVTREQNLRDLLAAYDRLAAQPLVDTSSIAVVGVSYGGYLAAILTSMRNVRWLALRSPAIYKDEEWEKPKLELHLDQDLPSYRRNPIDANSNRALRACSEFRGDVLLVQAEFDDIVPHEVGKNYVAAFSKTKSLSTRIVAGANHAFAEKQAQEDYDRALIGWLTEMIVGGRSASAKRSVEQHVEKRRAETGAAMH